MGNLYHLLIYSSKCAYIMKRVYNVDNDMYRSTNVYDWDVIDTACVNMNVDYIGKQRDLSVF